MGQLPSGPYFARKDFENLVNDMKKQEEYLLSPLRPVHEVLLPSFIHPRNPNKPTTISMGLLTGGSPLWGFCVDDGTGYGDLYYFVYDTKIIEHREDGTWCVEFEGVKLMKAQLGVPGYVPNLKEMYDSAIKVFGGYTKFTPGMIWRAGGMLLKDRGCLHAKPPDVPEYARSLASDLVGVICDYRIRPDLPMPVKLGEKERILQIGLSARLMDYYPKVEFIVWRRDRCPDMDVPLDEIVKELLEKGKKEFDEMVNGPHGKSVWPVPDTTFMAMRLHFPENKTQLIDTEAYLHGWSEKVFSSDDTAKLWKRTIQKNKLKTKVKQAVCVSL